MIGFQKACGLIMQRFRYATVNESLAGRVDVVLWSSRPEARTRVTEDGREIRFWVSGRNGAKVLSTFPYLMLDVVTEGTIALTDSPDSRIAAGGAEPHPLMHLTFEELARRAAAVLDFECMSAGYDRRIGTVLGFWKGRPVCDGVRWTAPEGSGVEALDEFLVKEELMKTLGFHVMLHRSWNENIYVLPVGQSGGDIR